jgi:hypothetical protein
VEGPVIAPDVLARLPDPALDARIAAAFAEDAKSADVRRVLGDVEAAAKGAEAAAQDARERALDPLVDDAIVARGAMDDSAFKRDRLIEAAKRLGKRVDELTALEADRRMQAEHERVEAERDKLAEEMENMADAIAQIANLVRQIEACDREIGRLNATSTSRFGYVRPVLSGATPAITSLFQDVLVWDAFIAVAGLQAPPVASDGTGANDKPRVRRSASSPAAL